MSDSIFDAEKNYYVFKYVIDAVTGNPTEHEGEVQAFGKGTDPWDAVSNAGFDDLNLYGANRMDEEHLDQFSKSIADERKHLTKISKQLKVITDERDEAVKKFMDEKPCPNGCGKLDDNYQCPNCGFGKEADNMVSDLDKLIKKEKKKGNDTSQLENLRDSIEVSNNSK